MKTTVEISDELYERARLRARATGRTMRSLVEDGLRGVLAADLEPPAYHLPDASVGDPSAPDPLEALSWQDLRHEIYGGR